MKVVVAHNRYVSTAPSGENTVVDRELRQLSSAGVDVIPFLRSSDEIATLPVTGKILLPLSPIYNGPSQRALAALIEAERPDLLHLHNPYPLLSPWVVRTAQRHQVRVVQTIHNYRHVCANGLYFRDGHMCHDCAGRRFALPAVQHSCYRGSRAQSVVMATSLAIHRTTWRQVDRYLALTPALAGYLRDFGIPEARITVKPNAIPDPGPAIGPGAGFLFAARLNPEKGLALVVDAWRRFPVGALGPLRIAGDGPQRPLAEALAAQREDVTYLGALAAEAVPPAIREAACIIVASTWDDVLPTIALEALAAGRAVLATRRGGLPYLVGAEHHCGAGWVVEPTVDAIAEALPVARAGAGAAGTAARQRYERHFAPDVLTQQLVKIYAEVAAP